ncbi:matrixin family metalloprotease [Candidatus Pacearchaeota archaeon]|nr:matrixin family metalloprotease [Candidatus Pacearchaeota archaeon]
MDFLDAFLLVLTIAIVIFGGYLLWSDFFSEPIEYHGRAQYIEQKLEGSSLQFYSNMRFQDRHINYMISGACDEERISSIKKAFEIIEQDTILEFSESGQMSEMYVTCSDVSPNSENKRHFIAGEGGPTFIVNTSLYSLIFNGTIALYRSEKCDRPQIALHEIFHVLGFDHSSNQDSIMYPVTNCRQEIDNSIIEEINRLYEDEPLPDLALSEAYATIRGRYLYFNISISNYGLLDSDNMTLNVKSIGNVIKQFPLGSLQVGRKKIFNAGNIRISKDAGEIEFEVIGNREEISLENNKVILSPSGN